MATKKDTENGPEQLANKYRVSWKQASEHQRINICTRLGIVYTHVNDESLLQDVAQKQQTLYRRSRKAREESLVKTAEQEQAELIIALQTGKIKTK